MTPWLRDRLGETEPAFAVERLRALFRIA